MQEEGGLFGAGVPERLREPWALGTPALAKIDGDASWGLAVVAQQLGGALGVPPSSLSWRVRSTVRLALCGPAAWFSCWADKSCLPKAAAWHLSSWGHMCSPGA